MNTPSRFVTIILVTQTALLLAVGLALWYLILLTKNESAIAEKNSENLITLIKNEKQSIDGLLQNSKEKKLYETKIVLCRDLYEELPLEDIFDKWYGGEFKPLNLTSDWRIVTTIYYDSPSLFTTTERFINSLCILERPVSN